MLHATGVVKREVWEYNSLSGTVKTILPPPDLKRARQDCAATCLQPTLPKLLVLINFLNCIAVRFLITLGNHSWIVTGSLSTAHIILAVALSAYSLA